MAFVALVIVFYLSANLCFTFAANTTSVNANDGHSSSNAALSHLHHDKTMSLMVCNSTVIFCLSTSCMSWVAAGWAKPSKILVGLATMHLAQTVIGLYVR